MSTKVKPASAYLLRIVGNISRICKNMFIKRIHDKNYACRPFLLKFTIKIEFSNLAAIFSHMPLQILAIFFFFVGHSNSGGCYILVGHNATRRNDIIFGQHEKLSKTSTIEK